jgi:hypothetical protein
MNFSISKKTSKSRLKLLGFESAAVAVADFRPGSRVIGLTKGQFSLLHLLLELLKKTGPAHVVCATWSAGLYDASVMKEYKDSGNILSFMLVTDRSYSTRQKQYALSIEEAFGADAIRTTNLHAKFVLLWNDNYAVVIRSSMNLNENKRCENFDIDDDKDIFAFYKRFIDEVELLPVGFVESTKIVNPHFDALMGDGPRKTKPAKAIQKIYDKNGNEI